MGWHSRSRRSSSFGGSTTHHFGQLETNPSAPGAGTSDGDPTAGTAAEGRRRIRSSAKQQEILAARAAGASAAQIKALIQALEQLAAGLGPELLLDWSVRFEPSTRSLCLRWRQLEAQGQQDPPAWQVQRFGGQTARTPKAATNKRGGFG